MTDEEREIEEALAGTEMPSSEKSESNIDINKYLSFLGNFGAISEKFVSTMDGFFKKDGKLTYVGPLTALFVSILIFFSVLAVTAMTVPRGLDVNGDGEINVLDIVAMVNFALGTDYPSDHEFWASDINNDGYVNVLDIVSIVNLILEN